MTEALTGVVTNTGLAASPASPDSTAQTAPIAVSREGQPIVRVADAGGLVEGTERFETRTFPQLSPAGLSDRLVVAIRPCRLKRLVGYVNGADDATGFYYIQLFNQTSITNGDIPVQEFPVPKAKGVFGWGFSLFYDVGLIVGMSTTRGTYTGGTLLLWAKAEALVDGGPIETTP